MSGHAEQGHAEDRLLRHRYLYYVLHAPMLTDAQYDALEAEVRSRWSIGVASHVVGSDNPHDYPPYIREGRRPDANERAERDWWIVKRWMDNL